MGKTIRVDRLLVSQGLAKDLDTARRMIMAGEVRADGQLVHKASRAVLPHTHLEIDRGPRFVSRAGEKLIAALEEFEIDVSGWVCADVGASTGGFTDCLLQQGARSVVAIDVGYGELAWKLRQDERVIMMERTNARTLRDLPVPVDLVTVDVSFISLQLFWPVFKAWFSDRDGQIIALVKPQFEATREEAARGKGVIVDPEIHRRVLHEVLGAAQALSFQIRGLISSPLLGPEGNREFLAWLSTEKAQKEPHLEDLIEACVS
jgi:23S rRNA (cytidine1920-2'-O)/16S rRNA (cytidine1409-2'-O)-methyltransferase